MIRVKLALVIVLLLCFAHGYKHVNRFGGASQDTPSRVAWEKPVTDAQWAEDTKNEQIAYRSDKVLAQMLAGQTAKLAKQQAGIDKYQNCPDCIYYEYRERFAASGMKDPNLETDARAAATTAINQRAWEISKIQQSVERIQKEQELRAKGFVSTDEKTTKQPLFGGARIVRHIID